MIKKLSLLSLTTLSLMASNGTNLIGTSTVSRSMGGTGVAFYSHATEAIGKNISLMNDIDDKEEFQFDLTYFKANLSSSVYDKMPLNANLNGENLPSYDQLTTAKSQDMIDTSFIPSVSYITRIDDQTVFGLAMIGAAGMADNYNGEYSQRQLKSSMMLMKIIPAISYRQGNTTFGFAPVLGLGSMSLNYDEAYLDKNGNLYPYGTKPQSDRQGLFGTNVGGDSLVPALGFTAGMDVKVTKKLRIGMSYNSALKYTYKDVTNFSQFGPQGMVYMADEWMRNNTSNNTGLDTSKGISQNLQEAGMNSLAADAIEVLAGTTTVQNALSATNPKNLDDLTLEQPWEIALGFAYDVTDIAIFTFDYRFIAWELAEGYKDFGWENQNVFAFGMQFQAKKNLQIRAGYNYANSPIASRSEEQGALLTDVQGHLVFDQAISMLNMVGFPAISTTHFTAGFGYQYSEFTTFDFAAVYSPEATTSRKGSLSPLQTGFDALDMSYEYATVMEQISLTFGLNYKF
jgi:long-chain fatty acid transport protein